MAGDTYIDVVFNGAGGGARSTRFAHRSTLTPESALGGSGRTARQRSTRRLAPDVLLSDGRTAATTSPARSRRAVRHRLVRRRRVERHAGNLGVAGAQTLQADRAAARAPGAGGSAPSKVFFIEISGGMQLCAGGLFGDTPDKPLLAIRGEVDAGDRHEALAATARTQHALHADRVRHDRRQQDRQHRLRRGGVRARDRRAASRTSQFWGVAAFQTNFDFLQPTGSTCPAARCSQINTTEPDADRDAVARGHPRRRDFVLPVRRARR